MKYIYCIGYINHGAIKYIGLAILLREQILLEREINTSNVKSNKTSVKLKCLVFLEKY